MPDALSRLAVEREKGLHAEGAKDYLALICEAQNMEIERDLKAWALEPTADRAMMICGRLAELIKIRDALNKDVKRGKKASEHMAPHLEGAPEQTP